MHPLLNIAITAARKAETVLLRSLDRLDTVRPTQKGLHDFVSDVDKKSEQEIIAIIKKAYPSHQIIGEEGGVQAGDEESVWIIDPLDGTHNYLRGFPHFSISIAFQFRGKLEHAVVYDPIRQEMFIASRGQGARLNDRRLRVSNTLRLNEALIGTGFPVRRPEDLPSYLQVFQKLMPQLSNIRCSGSAALDLAYVAAGRLDAFFEINLQAWDLAAAALLIKEAGGLVADWQGGEDYLHQGNVIAGTPKVFSALAQVIGNGKDAA